MNEFFQSLLNLETYQGVVNFAIVALPVILTWLGRRYVSATGSPNKLEALGSAASMAVNMVEQLDQNHKFDHLNPDEKSAAKRIEAYRVVHESLKRSGWTFSEESRWNFGRKRDESKDSTVIESAIQSELQKRYGTTVPVKEYTTAAAKAIEDILALERSRLFTPPDGVDPRAYLLDIAAKRMIAALARDMIAISPENADAWVEDSMVTREIGRTIPRAIVQSSAEQIDSMVVEAADFLKRLKSAGEPSIQLGDGRSSEDFDAYVVNSWLLVEAARRRLNVSIPDIGDASNRVLAMVEVGGAGDTVATVPG